jgi:hypothetical protein
MGLQNWLRGQDLNLRNGVIVVVHSCIWLKLPAPHYARLALQNQLYSRNDVQSGSRKCLVMFGARVGFGECLVRLRRPGMFGECLGTENRGRHDGFKKIKERRSALPPRCTLLDGFAISGQPVASPARGRAQFGGAVARIHPCGRAS